MKIEIQNLGPIHHFEFDLEKDLHLLYGENNVGKSFAVNVVYCLVKSFITVGNVDLSQGYVCENLSEQILLAEKILKQNLEKEVIPKFEKAFQNTYETWVPIGLMNNEKSVLNIETVTFSAQLVLATNGRFEVVSLNILDGCKSYLDKLIKESKEPLFPIYAIPQYPALTFSSIFLLPASRSGLYAPLSGMGEILAELSMFRNSLKSGIELPALSEPVSDYFIRLVSINGKESSKGIIDLAQKIEDKIIKGGISFNQTSKKIYFSPKDSSDNINITQTASMIAELAPLVLYLKHLFPQTDETEYKENSLLIIEEPEAHLHPKVQVQLMEIFAELTKHNVKVILTSHSNYMFNKLSNMLLKKEIAPEKVGVYHMVMTDKGSEVATDMQATEEGIEDHNFVGVAQQLYQERLETYDLLNEDPDADK